MTLNFFNDFQKEYGQKKAQEINQIINNSNAVRSLIKHGIFNFYVPNGRTITECLLGTRHFMFSKKPILMCAAMFTLFRYINLSNKQGISYQDYENLEGECNLKSV